MKLVLLGPPGSGKGSIAKLLIKNLNLSHLSTGDLFREKTKANDELAIQVKSYIESGQYVPDELTNEVAKEAILLVNDQNKDGFILDGYPRTINQAEFLESVTNLDYVLYLDVNENELIKRLSGRRLCPKCHVIYNVETAPKPKVENLCDTCLVPLLHRKDDDKNVSRHRIQVYKELTSPLIEYYQNKGLLKAFNAEQSLEQVYNEIFNFLKNKK